MNACNEIQQCLTRHLASTEGHAHRGLTVERFWFDRDVLGLNSYRKTVGHFGGLVEIRAECLRLSVFIQNVRPSAAILAVFHLEQIATNVQSNLFLLWIFLCIPTEYVWTQCALELLAVVVMESIK